MIRRLTKPVFRLLFFLLCIVYRVYATIKGLVCALADLLFIRQSRYKIFPFLRIDEDEVINRIRLNGKLPPALVLSLPTQSDELQSAASVCFKIALWSSRLDIKHVIVYVLSQESSKLKGQLRVKLEELDPSLKDSEQLRFGGTIIKLETFQGFYNQIAKQINQQGNIKYSEYKSPLLILFNKCRSLAGLPFEHLVSGEIMFEESFIDYTIIDYERNLKDYALTNQRSGK